MEVKAVYVHNPKTAGKTIYKSLQPQIVRSHELDSRVPKHCTAAWLVENMKYISVPMVSSTRNPWQRAVSLYRYLQSVNRLSSVTPFSTWIRFPKALGHCMDPYDRNPLQLETFITDKSGEVIVDYILRLEHLEEDFTKVAEELGVTKRIKTYKTKQNGKGDDYRKLYTDADMEYISELCAWEIDRYGYTF